MTGLPLPPTTATIRDDVPGAKKRELTAPMAASRPSVEFQKAFLRSKEHILNTHSTLGAPQRQRYLSLMSHSFANSLDGASPGQIRPVPGGVGYGTFYDPDYKTEFATGAEIIWNAVSPATMGGASTTYLYITATNRSSYGVEALVLYDGTGQFSFSIFDWSISAGTDANGNDVRWVKTMSFGEVAGKFQLQQTVGGASLAILPICNSTKKISDGQWRNEVFLYDKSLNNWASMYSHDYAATDDDQRSGWVGSWGPIIETFDTAYHNTNPLGAWNVQTRSADANGVWSQWYNLGPGQASLRVDGVGFQATTLDPYYDWIVSS
ncbi:hypothetical protein AAGS40_27230 (plasmid) [Paraburkholderia sp. PREW-6R]|uniref:hypothetical protein n=1 Tax=Paraburkholderia sp. PREW-6R TaxID=3141544 RepID=UPI0031F47D31